MDPVTFILLLFALTTALSFAAVHARIPYPTAMVIAGLLIGVALLLVPSLGVFAVKLDPKLIFTAILPPLLYGAAWNTSWNGFRANLRPILLLAIGAVIFTTVGLAALAMLLLPGFTWPMAFALGAIVSPPDAVAVSSLTQRLRIPKRITTILEGESLVNDAAALVVYRFAVAAALGAAFSLSGALIQFPLVAAGGIAVGLLLAWLLHQIHQRIEQPLIETAMTLLAPYAAYFLAEYAHTSGVLAVVACGLVLSRHSPHLFSAQTRLTAVAFWNFLTFMLNGLVCILIGLQLPEILHTIHTSFARTFADAAIICAGVILLRILWIFPAAWLPRLIPAIRKKDPLPEWRQIFLIGWVGMRGVVTLAAALALPERLPNGSELPGRDLVLFLSFAVILATLVGQSLTLPAVIRLLHIENRDHDRCDEVDARRRALTAALDMLAAEPESHGNAMIRALYAHRLEHLSTGDEMPEGPDPEHVLYRRSIRVQRATVVSLRDQGRITDELLRKLERELDLEETQIPE